MRLSKNQLQNQIKNGLKSETRVLGSTDILLPQVAAQNALVVAAQPVPPQIKSNLLKVVEKSERLLNSFKIYRGKRNPYKVYIGPDYRRDGGGQLAHIIEYGTVQRERRSISADDTVKIVSTGMVAARPFMRPAWEQVREKVIKTAEKSAKAIIESALKKGGFKK